MLCLLVSIGFQVLFHSPPGVLFTFPSRYYTLSVTWSYLAFGDGPPSFRQDSSCPDVLRILARLNKISPTGLLPCPAVLSRTLRLSRLSLLASPYPPRISTRRLGSSDFARHYFRNRSYFLFLRVIRCFSSPGSLRITIYSLYDTSTLLKVSSLIRISAGRSLCAAYRSFSQLVTSFFGAMYQGILPTLFVAYSCISSSNISQ